MEDKIEMNFKIKGYQQKSRPRNKKREGG